MRDVFNPFPERAGIPSRVSRFGAKPKFRNRIRFLKLLQRLDISASNLKAPGDG